MSTSRFGEDKEDKDKQVIRREASVWKDIQDCSTVSSFQYYKGLLQDS